MLGLKLNSKKPGVEQPVRDAVPPPMQRQGRKPQGPAAQPMKASDLEADAADPVGQQHGGQDADDEQHVEQGRALGGQDVARDQGASRCAGRRPRGRSPVTRMVGVKMPMP